MPASSARIASPALGTAAVFIVFQLVTLLAMSRVIAHVLRPRTIDEAATSHEEAVAWLVGSIVLFLIGIGQYAGYAVLRSATHTGADLHEHTLSAWRAERFATVTFWMSAAVLTLCVLAVASVIALRDALVVVAVFGAPLPFVWFTSLLAYYTRPSPDWLKTQHQHHHDDVSLASVDTAVSGTRS